MAAYHFIGLALLVAAIGIQTSTAETLILDADAKQRIVDGWPAEPKQWPWQISLRMVNYDQISECGGSLIHHKWAITAAHCTVHQNFIFVRLGLTNLTQPELVLEVTNWYEHPYYDTSLLYYDVTLIPFHRHVEYTPTMYPIRLEPSWRAYHNYNGAVVFASGFGVTDDYGTSSEILNWVHLRAISNEECENYFNLHYTLVVDETLCAHGLDTLSQSICQGDSGGPLVTLDEDGEYTLIGISSFGSAAGCSSSYPSGFFRAGAAHDWYLYETGINFDWDFDDETSSGSDQSYEYSVESEVSEEEYVEDYYEV